MESASSIAAGRKRIVVIGGGVGAMTTALELTATPELRARHELTVYQQGWRLGGKGASGRNPAVAQRIEEHGLHIWSGFYVNALRAMKQVYAEANRPAGCPLRTFDDAFKPHNNVSWAEHYLGHWKHWVEEMEERPNEKPGEPSGPIPTPLGLLWRMAPWALHFLADVKRSWQQPAWKKLHPATPAWLAWIADVVRLTWTLGCFAFVYLTNQLIHTTARVLRRPAARSPERTDTWFGKWLLALRRRIIRRVEQQPAILRLFILLDAAFCIVRGMVFGGVLWRGFDCLDRYDFREWLLLNGAIPEITVRSGLVRGTYDYIFAYVGGDTRKPSLAAGVALRMLLRLLLTYQRSVFWRMEAGMGDTIFAPMYEVLKARGVKFRFFHEVQNVGVSADRKSIATIRIGRQVTLRGGRKPEDYDPLVMVKGLPCWPSDPLYDQIDPTEAERLQRGRVDLCSAWSDWKCPEIFTLERGRDFDLVVYGASLATIPVIAPELIAPDGGSEKLRRLLDNVQTVPTLAMQLWCKKDAQGLGWHEGSTILTAYGEPFDTWADMTHLTPREDWPASATPRSIAYFCGPLREPKHLPPVGPHPEFPVQQEQRVQRIARWWLGRYTRGLWPNATVPTRPQHLDWALLLDLKEGQGTQRFDAQYFRANLNPSDRYVISLPGTTEFRLRPDESGYENLFLTGDWLRTGLNYGCVEGTVMAGMQTARAICGSPRDIYGETDFCKAR